MKKITEREREIVLGKTTKISTLEKLFPSPDEPTLFGGIIVFALPDIQNNYLHLNYSRMKPFLWRYQNLKERYDLEVKVTKFDSEVKDLEIKIMDLRGSKCLSGGSSPRILFNLCTHLLRN